MSDRATKTGPPRPRRLAPLVTILILAALTTWLLWRGYSFYRLDPVARPEHPEYRTLRAAGLLGHGYGIVGTGLILTNLLYLVRRRFAKHFPDWMGSVKAWLDMHVVTGLSGSLLVLFHSAFQVRTAIAAVSAASLAVVVGTGLVGLYLHALVPKTGVRPLTGRLAEVKSVLPGMAQAIEDYAAKISPTRLAADASFLRTLFTMPRWLLEARARRRGVKRAARGDKIYRVLARNEPKLARDLLAELEDLAAAEIDVNAVGALVRTWRSLHRFLAILMMLTVTVHIGVAWFYGFRWIFSE
jgi:hypothetical protein